MQAFVWVAWPVAISRLSEAIDYIGQIPKRMSYLNCPVDSCTVMTCELGHQAENATESAGADKTRDQDEVFVDLALVLAKRNTGAGIRADCRHALVFGQLVP